MRVVRHWFPREDVDDPSLEVLCQVWQSFKQTDLAKDVPVYDRTDGLDDISASFQPKKLCDSVIGIIRCTEWLTAGQASCQCHFSQWDEGLGVITQE